MRLLSPARPKKAGSLVSYMPLGTGPRELGARAALLACRQCAQSLSADCSHTGVIDRLLSITLTTGPTRPPALHHSSLRLHRSSRSHGISGQHT